MVQLRKKAKKAERKQLYDGCDGGARVVRVLKRKLPQGADADEGELLLSYYQKGKEELKELMQTKA
eukprot:7792788-Pyramimonas_sp.AAC.1